MRHPTEFVTFAATAACVAVLVGFLAHDAIGLSSRLIRRDALEGATFIGVALATGSMRPKDRR